MLKIIEHVRAELIRSASEQQRESAQHFFKEEVLMYGIKTPDVNRLAKSQIPLIKKLDKGDVFDLCETLWKSGVIEESFIACIWAESIHKTFDSDDFIVFERWVFNYISNWASCDTLCNHTVGLFVMKYPSFLKELKRWAHADSRWVKRAAAVTLIIPARKGLFLNDVFEIAEILLRDQDDLVQKGYGWMLKAASQAYPEEVFQFVMKYKNAMPRTALRYAIEKLNQDRRIQAMSR